MNKIFYFFYQTIKILNKVTVIFFKKDILLKLKDTIDKESYKIKKIHHKYLKFFVPNETINWRIKTFFEKEPETIEWIKTFKKKDRIIFWDIGSNIGIYSIYAAVIHKNIEVISFEPSTSNLRTLSRNISINNLSKKIKIIPLALNEKTNIFKNITETNFIEGGALNVFGEKFDYNGKKLKLTANEYTILGTNINFFLKNKILRVPHYIKIDVDGIEHLILKGGNQFFKNKNIKSVLIEINENFTRQYINIIKFMKANNFKLIKKTREEEFYGSKYSKIYNYIFQR